MESFLSLTYDFSAQLVQLVCILGLVFFKIYTKSWLLLDKKELFST